MKRILFVMGLFSALILTFAAFRSTVVKAEETAPDALRAEMLLASESPVYETATVADTLTDTENDTITHSTRFISLWTQNHTVDIVSLSGSVSVIAILQENNARTGGTWYEVERDTASAAGQIRLHGGSTSNTGLSYVKGLRQRLILDGSGTQSTTYSYKATYKKE